MFGAVGERSGRSTSTPCRRLKPGGKALVQSITIGERYFPRYRSSTDFIQQYIFPGGCCPAWSALNAAQRAPACSARTPTPSAATTPRPAPLAHAYHAERAQVVAQGFDAHFMRIWDLYFAYCEAAFDEGRTDVVQFLLHKLRRSWLAALTLAVLAASAACRRRLTGASVPQAQALGGGDLTWFGLRIYRATLWSASRPSTPPSRSHCSCTTTAASAASGWSTPASMKSAA
jgi:hypothetical protein